MSDPIKLSPYYSVTDYFIYQDGPDSLAHVVPLAEVGRHTYDDTCKCSLYLTDSVGDITDLPVHCFHNELIEPADNPPANPHYHIPGTKQYPDPCGHYVLIKIPEVQSVSDGGIILHSKTQEKREQEGMEVGEVMAFGPTAYTGWAGFEGPEAWGIAVGDLVEFKKYEGKKCFTEGYEDFHYIPDSVLIGCNRSASDE